MVLKKYIQKRREMQMMGLAQFGNPSGPEAILDGVDFGFELGIGEHFLLTHDTHKD